MNKSPNLNLNQFENSNSDISWDSLLGAPSRVNSESTDTPETNSEYNATNSELYQSVLGALNQELYTLERNGATAETKRDIEEPRDILVDAYATTLVESEPNKPSVSIISVLENRKAIYDKKADLSREAQDVDAIYRNTRLSEHTSGLISRIQNAKTTIEEGKDPNSSYNQFARQFDDNTPSATPAENNAAMFK